MSQNEEEKVSEAFRSTLNRHGYGFQYAVLNHAVKLYENKQSNWQIEVVEFPSETQGYGTRIDFILKRRSRLFSLRGHELPFYLLAECKRANPAISNWCFIEAPFTHRDPSNELYLEQTQLIEGKSIISDARDFYIGKEKKFYHIGFEIKSDQKGDKVGSTRGEIENAAAQVLRGMNGLVNYIATNSSLFYGEEKIYMLPAIFTTAKLWVTAANLNNADLETGNIDLGEHKCQNVDWLLYQYNTSPGLKHSYSNTEQYGSLTQILRREYIRTIPIISPQGIGPFLEWAGKRKFE